MKKQTKIAIGAAALLLIGGYVYTRQGGGGLDASSLGGGGGYDYGGGGALSLPEPQTHQPINIYLPAMTGADGNHSTTANTTPAEPTKKSTTQYVVNDNFGQGGIGGGSGGGGGGLRGDPLTATDYVKKAISYTAPGVIYDTATKGTNAYANLAQSATKAVTQSKTVTGAQTVVKKAMAVFN